MTVEDVVKVDGLVCVGVPIGTPTFVEDWASANIKDLITDLRKLRVMSDPLIHYHLVRFCGLTRPGYMCRTLPPDILQSSRVGLEDFDLAVAAEIFTKAIGDRWRSWPPGTLAWHRTTLQLPHHKGGLGLTPVCASGIAAFYSPSVTSTSGFSATTTASSLTPRPRVTLPMPLMDQQRLMVQPHVFSSRNSLHFPRDLQMIMLTPPRACFLNGESLSRS